MATRVLITGGTGAIGSQLCDFLSGQGIEVSVLSRSLRPNAKYQTFLWDYKRALIDKKAFENCDYIIHLAGAGIADKRWTAARKKEILDSRVLTTALLYKALSSMDHKVKGIISASAVGYYGQVTSPKIFKEDDPPGNDFVADVCRAWEKEVNRFQELSLRTVNLRIGIVLMSKGGALEKMALPFRWYVGAPLANGKQLIPWIHIEDLIRIVLHTINTENLKGPYNCCAPESANNQEFSSSISKILSKPIWLPKIPSAALKLLLGNRAILLTKGSRVSSKKIIDSGFHFNFPKLEAALVNCLT